MLIKKVVPLMRAVSLQTGTPRPSTSAIAQTKIVAVLVAAPRKHARHFTSIDHPPLRESERPTAGNPVESLGLRGDIGEKTIMIPGFLNSLPTFQGFITKRLKLLSLAILWATLALTSHAVEFSTVAFGGNQYTVCRIDVRKERLQLFHRDENGQPFKRFDRLAPWLETRGQKLTFAMNAGMYHADFSTVGLFVSGGRQDAPLNTANGDGNFFLKPNGVFAVTDSGARVIESSEYPTLREHVILATQSGPLLVRGGKLHPTFKAGSESRLFRNGVGVPSPDIALFVISEGPVNFYDFATFFRDELHCQDAIFLDGTISSLYAPKIRRSDFRIDLGPIIAVTE